MCVWLCAAVQCVCVCTVVQCVCVCAVVQRVCVCCAVCSVRFSFFSNNPTSIRIGSGEDHNPIEFVIFNPIGFQSRPKSEIFRVGSGRVKCPPLVRTMMFLAYFKL